MSSIDDCYFYFYSTCLKGDQCPYRHCKEALGNETMCLLWQQGQCLDINCRDRHMKITKARNDLICYFETTPSGCLKSHCPFKHVKPRKLNSLMNIKPVPGNDNRKECQLLLQVAAVNAVQGLCPKPSHLIPEPSTFEVKSLKEIQQMKRLQMESLKSTEIGANPFKESSSKNFSFELAKVKSSESTLIDPFLVTSTLRKNLLDKRKREEEAMQSKDDEKVSPVAKQQLKGDGESLTVQVAKLKARTERFGRGDVGKHSEGVEKKSILSVEVERSSEAILAEKTKRADRLAMLKKRWEMRKKKEEEKRKKMEKDEKKTDRKIREIIWKKEDTEPEQSKAEIGKVQVETSASIQPKRITSERKGPVTSPLPNQIVVKSFQEIMLEKQKNKIPDRKKGNGSEELNKTKVASSMSSGSQNRLLTRKRLYKSNQVNTSNQLPSPEVQLAKSEIPSDPLAKRRTLRRPSAVGKSKDNPGGGAGTKLTVTSTNVTVVSKIRSPSPVGGVSRVLDTHSHMGTYVESRRETSEGDVLDDLELVMKEFSGVEDQVPGEEDEIKEEDHDDLMLDIEEVMNI